MKFFKKHIRLFSLVCACCLWFVSIMQGPLDVLAAAPVITTVSHPEQNTIKLSWNPVSGVSGYNIYMSLATDANMQYIASVNDTKFSFTGLSANSKYNFKIVPYIVSGGNKVEATPSDATSVTETANRQGIDVSHYQGNIDWAKLKANTDVRFVMIKLGEGSSLDSCFKKNIQNAKANGFKVGVYYYTHATTQEEAQQEANFVVENLKGYSIDYPVAMDIEAPEQKKLTKVQNTLNITTFCEAIKAAGYSPMVYTFYSYMNSYLDYNGIKQYDIWLARYNSYLGYDNPVRMWQYSSTTTLPGITANTVDTNYEYDKDDMNGSVIFDLSKSALYYRVASGDTLQTISDKVGMSVSEIIAQNTGLTETSQLTAGQDIGLHNITFTVSTAPVETPVASTTPAITLAKPKSVKAKRASATSIKVTWKKVTNANKYYVYRATAKKGKYKKIKTVKGTSFTNVKLTTGKTYYYKIYAVYQSGSTLKKSAASAIVSAKPYLSKPTLKAAKAGRKQVKVTWKKVSGASRYQVFMSTKSNKGYKKVKDVKGTSVTIKKLKAKKKYYFKVKAYKVVSKKKVMSSYSNRKSTKTK
ncbi:hypothetical protein lbkm_2578 [Lachnospiraceae bacterium KM106-2]|nr:hypothetical protein lbkm_2578 [Lachnospiraceae bacterium KM106-2]